MSLIALVLSLFVTAPPPASSPLVEVWTWFEPDPADAVGVSPELGPTPAPLTPRGPWTPSLVLRRDGTFAYVEPGLGERPYVEGRLDAERVALLQMLVDTLGVGEGSRRWVCAARDPSEPEPFGRWDSGQRLRLVVTGRVFEWPDCADADVPARLLHLTRVAYHLVRGAPLPAATTPILTLRQAPIGDAKASTTLVTIDGAGRWTTPQARGQLPPDALARLREAIRDTRLELAYAQFHCEAEPTHTTTLDLGLAGSIGWSAPCGGAPHPDVTELMTLAHALTKAP